MPASTTQEKIIGAALGDQCVISCAGSGKTFTAVRRLLEIRKRLQASQGQVALLSYSNVAVETFRVQYSELTSTAPSLANGVHISTVDSFLTTFIVSPHGSRHMHCGRYPYLVQGHEPFLEGFKLKHGAYPIDIRNLDVSIDKEGGLLYLDRSGYGVAKVVPPNIAEPVINRLGKIGAYTHALARYWAFRILSAETRLAEILAKRFPFMLIDEAQDIGLIHWALSTRMREYGTKLTLIGDPNQAIYEFADADGSVLKNFQSGADAQQFKLDENRRSLASIVHVANSIAGTEGNAIRSDPARKCGAFFVTYRKAELQKAVGAFAALLNSNDYEIAKAAVLCRGKEMVNSVLGSSHKTGQGATDKFARAAIARDRSGDIATSFEFVVDGVIRLLNDTGKLLRSELLGASEIREVRTLRRVLWSFLRSKDKGLPNSTLLAESQWHPNLKSNVDSLLKSIEEKSGLKRSSRWANNLTKAKLENKPLCEFDLLSDDQRIRVCTVHKAKGESIEGVMYLARKADLEQLLAGPTSEDGRIGYVAITRATDLLIVGIPDTTSVATIEALESHGLSRWE